MIQSVGNRDFSAQETAHLLLSLPHYTCTYRFVTINLRWRQTNSRKLLKLKPWHTNPANAWENQPPSSNDIFISSYREFLTTEFAQLHVTTLANDLERAQEYTYLRKLLM